MRVRVTPTLTPTLTLTLTLTLALTLALALTLTRKAKAAMVRSVMTRAASSASAAREDRSTWGATVRPYVPDARG